MYIPMPVQATRQRPLPAVAFGSLLDLVRWRSEPAQAEVCEACQTINACHARFCKGCDGKLPAYFATVDGETHHSPLIPGGDTQASHSRYALIALVGLWGTVTAVTLLLAHGPRDAGVPSRPLERAALPAPIERVVALVDPPAAAETTRIAQGLVPVAATQADGPPPVLTPEAAAMNFVPESPIASRMARTSAPPAAKPRPVRSAGVERPVARCGGLNFVARAVCMNNQCARPEMRRSAQCVETVRQQRLDEARRNPKLMG
ncbi:MULTISPECIES: hypothetical protein [unclassified Variovorax]|uniref:hypothetical protein n=1 Tax=unclassified Variovorax TaxID=663243 RepID=UPI00076DDAB8|nr:MULTISPECIES: hypothetical protein [unclassified Variovorax]KWT85689.1 hypothetical protein APY03_3866 [Variovorax sp. WDL1]PNG58318.1 hypothetical protein CHC07_00042 [Variovorax sp. B4]PNG61892.1 hypothetical protein CHC06_01794 [Variovorax sp. B2]VTV12034.1 hypothetical protein WDL1CHR_02870 [Variovorax sp. WDL1]